MNVAIPIKVYLQKQRQGEVWPEGCIFMITGLKI